VYYHFVGYSSTAVTYGIGSTGHRVNWSPSQLVSRQTGHWANWSPVASWPA